MDTVVLAANPLVVLHHRLRPIVKVLSRHVAVSVPDYRPILKLVQGLLRPKELRHLLRGRLVVTNKRVFQSWGHACLGCDLRRPDILIEPHSFLRWLAIEVGVV